MRRTSDRIEAICVLLLVTVFLLAAPAAAWHTGTSSYRDGVRAERTQRTERTRVRAVVLEEPASSIAPGGVPQVRAYWSTPDGTGRTGLVPLTSRATKGDPVWIWVDSAGRPVQPPQDRGQTTASAVLVAATPGIGLAVGLLALRLLLRRVLDRRRLAGWEAAWRRTEPQWSGRQRGQP